jgi:hypothetical protein
MPTHSRVGKSVTREMVEKDVIRLGSRMHEPSEWKSSSRGNLVFGIAVVVIVAAVVLALVLLK